MIPDLLAKLVELLEQRIAGLSPGSAIRTHDLTESHRELMRREEEQIPKWRMGAKITKRQAGQRQETVRRFYKVVRLLDSSAVGEVEKLKAEIAELNRRKPIYIAGNEPPDKRYMPLKHPEEG